MKDLGSDKLLNASLGLEKTKTDCHGVSILLLKYRHYQRTISCDQKVGDDERGDGYQLDLFEVFCIVVASQFD